MKVHTPVLSGGFYDLGILTLEYDDLPKELLFSHSPVRDVNGNISPCAPQPKPVTSYHDMEEGYLYRFSGTNFLGNPIYEFEEKQSIYNISKRHLWDQPAGLIIKGTAGALWSNQAGEGCCAHPVERGRYIDIDEPNPFHDGYCLDEMYGIYAGRRGSARWSNDTMESIDKDLKVVGLRLDRDLMPWSMEAWLHVVMADGAKAILTYGNCD